MLTKWGRESSTSLSKDSSTFRNFSLAVNIEFATDFIVGYVSYEARLQFGVEEGNVIGVVLGWGKLIE